VTAWRVALTFDIEHSDRPSGSGTTERLLDAIEAAAVPTTLFVQGRWAEAYPATARRIGSGAHLVGHHSYYHARMSLLTDAGFATDLRDGETAIREFVGADPSPWFRLPFGDGADDPRVVAAIAAAGYRHIGWDVDGLDWQVGREAAGLVADIVAGATEHGDGAIVLCHGWPDATHEALPGIVARLRDAGAEFVRVDALDAA
jgi:peptidoglycan/xylan/chitin deacetylase (PgdA/CDA1 family)